MREDFMKTKKFLLFIFLSVFLVLGNSCASNGERFRPYADSGYKGSTDLDDDLYVMNVGRKVFRSSDYHNASHKSSDYSFVSPSSSVGYMGSSLVDHRRYCDDKSDNSSDHTCAERERKDYSPPGGIPDWVKKK